MTLLADIEPETKVVVTRIRGGREVKRQLGDFGISEGVELNILAETLFCKDTGPIAVKIGDKDVAFAHGMAERVYVDKDGDTLSLLEFERVHNSAVRPLG